MADIDYSKLDPGIRDTVRRLREWGYNTIDSGDGVTKPEDERVFEVPHVFIKSASGAHAIIEAKRLLEQLTEAGFCVEPIGTSGISVQANYDPADGTATVLVWGVGDRGWR